MQTVARSRDDLAAAPKQVRNWLSENDTGGLAYLGQNFPMVFLLPVSHLFMPSQSDLIIRAMNVLVGSEEALHKNA